MDWSNFGVDFIVATLGAMVGFSLTLLGQWWFKRKSESERRKIMFAILRDELELVRCGICRCKTIQEGDSAATLKPEHLPSPFIVSAWETLIHTGMALDLVGKKYQDIFDALKMAYANIEIYANPKVTFNTYADGADFLNKVDELCEVAISMIVKDL